MALPEESDGRAEPAELEQLLNLLRGAALFWARGKPFDEREVAEVRSRAILLTHGWYVDRIPVYGQLAEEREAVDLDDVRIVADECLFGTELFKSYDPRWLEEARYDRMTDWLRRLFVRDPRVALDGVDDVETWRDRLRGDQIHLMYSSGTSGRLSFVPRDVATWRALCENPRFYSRPLGDGDEPTVGASDCLILGPRGSGFGLQAAGIGLARTAERTHYLFDTLFDADTFRSLRSTSPRVARDSGTAEFVEATTVERDGAYAAALAFLREAVAGNRRVAVFGPPFQVAELCARVRAEGTGLRLPPGSSVLTGGGWKLNEHERVTQAELAERVDGALGVPRPYLVDAYSTAELNCVLVSCGEGRYHVPPLIEAVVVDDLFMTVHGDDVTGRLGFLDPFARSYPGFFVTGDIGRLVCGGCKCGLSGPAFVGEIRRAPSEETTGCAAVLASASA
jgi:Acyl-protein synthetase, LuxE